MMSKTCVGWAHYWRLAKADVATFTPTREDAAVQKTRVDVGISFKPRVMIFKGSNILMGRRINLG